MSNKNTCDPDKILSTYDEDTSIAQYEALRNNTDELFQWIKANNAIQNRTYGEQTNTIECLFENIKDSELVETSLHADNLRLNDVKACLTEQLNSLQRNEQGLYDDIDKLKTAKTDLENKLRCVEVSTKFISSYFNLMCNNNKHEILHVDKYLSTRARLIIE